MPDDARAYPLLDAWRHTADALLPWHLGEDRDNLDDRAEDRLLDGLRNGDLVATGISKPGNGERQPIAAAVWELATSDQFAHHHERRTLVKYVYDKDPGSHFGTLTPSGSADCSWWRIEVDGPKFRAWLQGMPQAEPEARWTTDQVLIWIASRRLDMVARASRRQKTHRLAWPTFQLENEAATNIDYRAVEEALLGDLHHGRLNSLLGQEHLTPGRAADAVWEPQVPSDVWPMSMALRIEGNRVFLGNGADGVGEFYGRECASGPIRVTLNSTDVLRLYPAPASSTPLDGERQVDAADRLAPAPAKAAKFSRSAAERSAAVLVTELEAAGTQPTRKDFVRIIQARTDGISESVARGLWKVHRPSAWSKPGPRGPRSDP